MTGLAPLCGLQQRPHVAERAGHAGVPGHRSSRACGRDSAPPHSRGRGGSGSPRACRCRPRRRRSQDSPAPCRAVAEVNIGDPRRLGIAVDHGVDRAFGHLLHAAETQLQLVHRARIERDQPVLRCGRSPPAGRTGNCRRSADRDTDPGRASSRLSTGTARARRNAAPLAGCSGAILRAFPNSTRAQGRVGGGSTPTSSTASEAVPRRPHSPMIAGRAQPPVGSAYG